MNWELRVYIFLAMIIKLYQLYKEGKFKWQK